MRRRKRERCREMCVVNWRTREEGRRGHRELWSNLSNTSVQIKKRRENGKHYSKCIRVAGDSGDVQNIHLSHLRRQLWTTNTFLFNFVETTLLLDTEEGKRGLGVRKHYLDAGVLFNDR